MGVEIVDEFHERRQRRVEVPARIEVISNLVDRLVQFAQQGAVGIGRGLGGFTDAAAGVLGGESIEPREKPLHALDAGFVPVEVLFGRRGEE